MKISIDRFTLSLLKENILYFTSIIVFALLLIFLMPSLIQDSTQLQSSATQKESELKELNEASKKLGPLFGPDFASLSSRALLFYPENESFFSIFSALDRLASRSGIFLTGYSSPYLGAQPDGVKVIVKAIGDGEAVKRLLTDYKFKSGRLVGIENIEFSPVTSVIDFTVIFYYSPAKKISAREVSPVPEAIIEKIRRYAYEEKTETVIEEAYSTTANPFVGN